jgi:hypothetical protein
MGSHYNVFVFDDHLGLLDGRSCDQEAEHLNKKLEKAGATIFHPFKYIKEGHCLVGELRKSNPSWDDFKKCFDYDYAYYRTDNSGQFMKI